jgi:PKD repeat protein
MIMRSIGTLAAVIGTLVLASSCSDGGGTPPPDNTAPAASFAVPPCTINVACDFVSTSTDDVAVTEWSWDFSGDGTPDANTANASYTYTTAGDFNVTLTVGDEQGLSHTRTNTITIGPLGSAPPVANFAVPSCTIGVACDFVSTSTDDLAVTEWNWDFNGDGTPDASTANASFTYTAAGDFNVSLTVRDDRGSSHTKTSPITIAPPAVNLPPTAGFTYSCPGAACSFTSTSTDPAPGTIVTYAWSFGDGGTSEVQNPLYSYAITLPRTFTVTLTVTDNEGASDLETQTITVTPPVAGAEGCITKNISDVRIVDCALNVPARSTMKLKLIDINCDLRRQKVVTPPPISDQVFLAVCSEVEGKELGIFGGPLDELIVYEAGSQVVIRFVQGIPHNGAPALGPPAATFTGTFPDWTINFEDGENPGAAGEPDFIDVVVGVHATVLP